MNTKKLRKKILSLAIHGKLVPQDPSDEPTIELLKRINPSFTPPAYDEPLPQGWYVAPMSMLCKLMDGEKVEDREMINLDAKYLRGTSKGSKLKSGRLIPVNSLLILVDGENSGEVFRAPIDGYQGSTFKRLIIDSNMYEKFMLQVINFHRLKLRANKVGAAIPHLNKKLFSELDVLVPPLAEQGRIVAKLEELFARVDVIEQGQETLQKKIKQLRNKLLTLAISGQLLPQDPTDEPAIELLQRINPSFTPLKYDKPLPEGWTVATMSTLCSLTDGERIENRELVNLDADYLRGKSKGKFFNTGKYIPINNYVILVDGENSGEVFRALVEGYQGSTFKQLVINENMHEEFVIQFVKSHQTTLKHNKIGSATPHLNKKLFKDLVIPVPPLAEQKRIVERLESLFSLLNNIETNLN